MWGRRLLSPAEDSHRGTTWHWEARLFHTQGGPSRFLAVSSTDDKELVLRGVEGGAIDFLVKPVQIPQLKNIWQHVLRKQRRRSSLQSVGGEDATGRRPSSPGHTSWSGQSGNAGSQPLNGSTERAGGESARQCPDSLDQAPARAESAVPTGPQANATTSSAQVCTASRLQL